MRVNYSPYFVLLLLLFSTCTKKAEVSPVSPVTPVPPVPERPAPQASKKVSINVDKAYDLSRTLSYSLLDSVALDQKTPHLYIPENRQSLALFIDKTSNEIMAVVRTNPQSTTLEVTAQAVTEGLYDLLPAYLELTPAQREEFETKVQAREEYKSFLTIIDNRLKTKKPVYDIDKTYLAELRKLNLYITSTYFKDLKTGGRVSAGARVTADPADINSWISVEDNQVENQVYSHVDLLLTPDGGQPLVVPLGPRNFILPQNPSSLGDYPDNYYTLQLTQKTERTRKENTAAAASKMTSILFGLLFQDLPGSCAQEIMSALSGDIYGWVVSGNMGVRAEDDFSNLVNMTGNVAQMVLTNPKCGKQALFRFMLKMTWKRATMLTNLWQVGWAASDWIQMLNFRKALKEPVDLTVPMQLYQSKVITGQVDFGKTGDMAAAYKVKDIANPAGEAKKMNEFAPFTFPGFKVEWKLKPEHGTVSPGTSQTDGTGKTRATWTMPDQAQDNAVLEAHLTDKEGDHLKGSPLRFSTKVICKEPISMSFLGLNNHKVIPGEDKTVKEYSMDFKFTDPCNMIGQAKQANLVITWTNASDGVPHPSQIDLKSFAGQTTFNYSAGGSVWWFYNSTTQQYCCSTSYTYKLILDGVSYGEASAVSPGP